MFTILVWTMHDSTSLQKLEEFPWTPWHNRNIKWSNKRRK